MASLCFLEHIGRAVVAASPTCQHVDKKHRRAMYHRAVTMLYIYHTLKMNFVGQNVMLFH